ncbi:MAG TPA: glycosyltransferase family 4 protein [Acidothermaceae bacterium]|nr:glycosyltransferase family 4 protein [Acidothermaceae bacterium]
MGSDDVRIAVVGPTHPHTGGIVHHTTELCHRLAAAGHDVDLVSWSAQYPAFLHPGTLRVPGGEPEVRIYPATSYQLAWWNPITWWRTGVGLRGYSAVVLVHASTVQVPAYLTILRALRARRTLSRPRVVVVAHNVFPHERHHGDSVLVKALLSRAAAVLVHSPELAALAKTVVNHRTQIVVADIPPHLPAFPVERRVMTDSDEPFNRLLFFGTVRPYKGLDVLLRSMVSVPEVKLVVAGDIWSGVSGLRDQIAELGLLDRVMLRPSYVAGSEIAGLFRDVDALVLPYRAGTASQNVLLAHAMGVPVIATRAGTLGTQVNDGVDGILAEPDDVDDLTAALKRFYSPGTPQKLRAGVPIVDTESSWNGYVEVLTAALAGVAVADTRASR